MWQSTVEHDNIMKERARDIEKLWRCCLTQKEDTSKNLDHHECIVRELGSAEGPWKAIFHCVITCPHLLGHDSIDSPENTGLQEESIRKD